MDFGQNFKIGFAGWVSNLRGKNLVCSDLHIGSGSASYEELLGQEAISFLDFLDNPLPEASNVRLDQASYQVGDTANVTFDFLDADEDTHGESLYRFTCVDENGKIWEEVGKSPSAVIMQAGELTCTVYPVDELGCVGEPALSQPVTVSSPENGAAITELKFNGDVLYQFGQTQKEFDISVPAELSKAVIEYRNHSGDVTINGNAASNPAVVNIENLNELTIACGEETFLIRLHAIQDNYAELTGISIEDLSFEPDSLSDGSWFLNADGSVSEAELKLTADERIGKVELFGGYGRKEIALTKTGNVWTGRLNFVNGLNSYYIRAVAKDGITEKQYQTHVNYAASTNARLAGIKVDNVSVGEFNHDGKRMRRTLEEGSDSARIEKKAMRPMSVFCQAIRW